jgi:hypothetical protein
VNGMLLLSESPAPLSRRRHPAVAYIRTIPKQGVVSFTAIDLGSFSGGFDIGKFDLQCFIATETYMTEPDASTASESLTDPLPELERAVAERPDDAKALVALANHYWLIGAGPEAVGDLASRAIASDADNRAAWHLWALSESDPRERVSRWQQVSARFPRDELAKANLADNAASLAGAEHDYQAVDLAIETYEDLLATAQEPDQRTALEKAIKTLKGWKF